MPINHRKGKQTKGKQKIEMKKVEGYGDRMITFSKRKAGIIKKMTEIVTMCNVETAFLVFSQAGKPYTFAYPSIEEVAARLRDPLRQEPVTQDETGPILEAYKKRKIEELIKKYEELEDELEMEEEKLKMMKQLKREKKLGKMWWNVSPQGMSKEDLKERHDAFVELYENLCDLAHLRLGEDNGASSSGSDGPRSATPSGEEDARGPSDGGEA